MASLDGAVVDSVHVSPVESPEYDAQLIGMHVEPHLTGCGIGGLLMKSALEFIREQGFERVELGVIVGNFGARRFYEAYGWGLGRTPFPKGGLKACHRPCTSFPEDLKTCLPVERGERLIGVGRLKLDALDLHPPDSSPDHRLHRDFYAFN